MTKHFSCTACGKCCYGQLPLSWKDALTNAGRFPLCIVWTPVLPENKEFRLVRELGATIKLPNRKDLAVLIVPTSFIPSTFPCPALSEDKLCGIHREKPARCKTMPFFPYRDERNQAELLIPRQGWECDTSDAAPVVYDDRKIIHREDFDQEKAGLIDQVPLLRRYADYMIKYSHTHIQSLMLAAMQNKRGQVITSLSSFLTATKFSEAKQIAEQQVPVLNDYIAKTADDPKLVEFHRNYVNWAKEMSFLART